jgi:hypothetical protein
MRIGELLIACDLINAKQLAAGLEYARAKGLPIGRVLKLLKHLDDANLEIALWGQRCIRSGMDPQIVVAAAKEAIVTGAPFEQVLKAHATGVVTREIEKADLVAVNVPVAHADRTAGELVKAADEALYEDRLEEAEQLYKQAVANLESKKSDVIGLADACSRLAAFCLLTDRWIESETLYQHVLSLRTAKLGADDISIARVYTDLADLYDVWDQYARSTEFALKACDVLQKHLPGAFDEFYGPLRKLTAFSKKFAQAPRRRMGELLTETGMLTHAKLETALLRGKQTNKPLGSVLKDEGLLAEQELQSLLSAQLLMKEGVLTEEIAVEALKVARKMNMPFRGVVDHFKLLSAATDDDALAELVMEQDRLVAAENGLGINHPEVGVIAYELAEKYFQRNSLADAEVFLKRAQSIDALTHALPPDVMSKVCERLAMIFKSTGRELLAAPLLLRALESLSKAGETESERGSRILLMLAEVEMQQKNFNVALSFLRSVHALQEKIKEAEDRRIAVLDKLGACLVEMDQLNEAETMLNKLVAVAESVYGPTDAETAKYIERLGDVHAWLGASDQAQSEYMRCLQVYEYALNAAPGAAQAVAGKLKKLQPN